MVYINAQSIQDAINKLPDVAIYPDDEFAFETLEAIDPDAMQRPATLSYRNIVFRKNHNKNGWLIVLPE